MAKLTAYSQQSGNRFIESFIDSVIPSADFMIFRLTTVHENARSALECGPAVRDRLEFQAKRR